MKVLIHHSEITLKGKNTRFYEEKLINNIRKSSKIDGIKVRITKDSRRLICHFDSKEKSKIKKIVRRVMGIKNYSFPGIIKRDIKSILTETNKILRQFKKQGVGKVSIEVKRSDKTFPMNSVEVSKQIGGIVSDLGMNVNFDNGKLITVEITHKKAYIYTEKFEGYAGLPVGSTGKVLCLLSGGIDSPVAAFLLMKRGCRVDFLHFHTYKENKKVLESKITHIVKILNQYQYRSKLFLIPYHKYNVKSLGKVKDNLDLVMFRNYMLRTARKVAVKNGHRALVTGDSLGQVASQTLMNLTASSLEVNYLILRPLLTYNKHQIKTLAKEIGTYKDSIKKYKDCCSIISRKPETSVQVDTMEKALIKFDMDNIIYDSLKSVERFDFNSP